MGWKLTGQVGTFIIWKILYIICYLSSCEWISVWKPLTSHLTLKNPVLNRKEEKCDMWLSWGKQIPLYCKIFGLK